MDAIRRRVDYGPWEIDPMRDDEKKKRKHVTAGGKVFPAEPGVLDQLKEGFEDANTRAQLEAIRRRRRSGA